MTDTFENDYTLQYKLGVEFGVPARFVAYFGEDEEPSSLENYLVAHVDGIIEEVNSDSVEDILAYIRDNSYISGILADVEGIDVTAKEIVFLFLIALTQVTPLGNLDTDKMFEFVKPYLGDVYEVIETFPRDVQNFVSQYNIFIRSYGTEADETKARYEKILTAQEALRALEPLPSSDITFRTKQLVFTFNTRRTPTSKVSEVVDVVDIFDASLLTDFIPLIETSINEEFTYKIKEEYAPAYDLFKTERKIAPTNINFALWLSNVPMKDSELTRDKFAFCTLDLLTKILYINNVPEREDVETEIKRLIEAAFPLVMFEFTKSARHTGEVTIYDVKFDRATFAEYVLNDPIASSYLFINESVSSVAGKHGTKIHYRSILNQSEEEGSNHSSVSANVTPLLLEGRYQIILTLSKAPNREESRKFLEVITRLFRRYTKERSKLATFYKQFVPKFVENFPAESRPDDISAIKKLQQETTVFAGGVGRECQLGTLPEIISPEEANDWVRHTFEMGGVTYHRQVLKFPPPSLLKDPEDQQYLFVAPDAREARPAHGKHPFIGLKEDARSPYGYIPCCFNTDHMNPSNSSVYNNLYLQIPKRTDSERSSIVRTYKILDRNRYGDLPQDIDRILGPILKLEMEAINQEKQSRYGFTEETRNWLPKRQGIDRDSARSFLQCIQTAVKPEEDIETTFNGILEDMLSGELPFEILKQEFYDQDVSSLKKYLREDVFIDPDLFYHLLEILFDINIFVFSPSLHERMTKADDKGVLRYPRHRLYPIRKLVGSSGSYRSLIIYRHWGTESDKQDAYPVCELIVNLNSRDPKTSAVIFGNEVTMALNQLYSQSLVKYYLAEGVINRDIEVDYVDFVLTKLGITEEEVTQIIDGYGKLRGLNTPYGTVMIPPSQPILAPSRRGKYFDPKKLELLGTPTAKTSQGLWFVDIFVALKESKDYDLPQGPPPPLVIPPYKEDHIVESTRDVYKVLNVILGYVRWLLIKYLRDHSDDMESAYRQFVKLIREENFDWKEYDIESVNRVFPSVNTYVAAVEYAETTFPSLVQGGYIRAYNKEFARKLKLRLAWIYKEKLQTPDVIENFYVSESDFKKQEGTLIVMGAQNFMTYIRQQKVGFNPWLVYPKLGIELGTLSHPYMYKSGVGNLYLMQNTTTRKAALSIAYHYHNEGINRPMADDIDLRIPYVVFQVSTTGELAPKENYTYGADKYLMLLQYSDQRYAAMMPQNQ